MKQSLLRKRSKNQRAHFSRIGGIQEEILSELSLGDILIGALCSARSTRRMYRTAHERAMHRYRRKLAVARLVEHGYVLRSGDTLSLGAEGSRALGRLIDEVRTSLRRTQWDGKWRMVSFDVPERNRALRNQVRGILVKAGFKKLHQSLWVFPHDCHELVSLIKSETAASRYVLYGVMESVENDEHLRRVFEVGKSMF